MTSHISTRKVQWLVKNDVVGMPPEAHRVAVDEESRIYIFAPSNVILEVVQSGKQAQFVFHEDGTPYIALSWFYEQYPDDPEVLRMGFEMEHTVLASMSGEER